MRAAVLQDRIGLDGRSRVVGHILELLRSIGYESTLFTRSTPETVEQTWIELFGGRLTPTSRVSRLSLPLPTRRGSLYSTLLCNLLAARHLESYDLVVNSNNYLFVPWRNHPPVIHYIHYPPYAANGLPPRLRGAVGSVYRFPLRGLRLFDAELGRHQVRRILANSHYTAREIARVYPALADDVAVVYPPVEIMCNEACDSSQRGQNRVMILSRLHPDKELERALYIAQTLPFLLFTLVGSEASSQYTQQIRRQILELKLHNVQLIADASASHVQRSLRESSMLLHTSTTEPFGIAIAEAMANGVIPIVPNSGGPAEIVRFRALRYNTIHEARRILIRLSTAKELSKLRGLLRYDASVRFHPAHFYQTFAAAVERTRCSLETPSDRTAARPMWGR